MSEIEERAKAEFSEVEIRYESLKKENTYTLTPEMIDLMDEVEKADRSYKLALDDPAIYLKFSLVCLSNEELKKAEEWVKKSLRVKKSFFGLLTRGVILHRIGDHKGAIGYYDEALEYKNDFLAHKFKYEALKERDMPERALESLDKALEKKESAELLAEKGDILVDLGKIDEAREFYKKAEELDPEVSNKREKVEELLEEAEKKTVPRMYDHVLKLDRTHNKAWLGKARCYWNLNQEKKAKTCLNRALEVVDEQEVLDQLQRYEELSRTAPDCSACGGSGKCERCGGTGDCEVCSGSGDCPDCDGTAECFHCEGTGQCDNCGGEGKTSWFSKCDVCGGSGGCQPCKSSGICPTCKGRADCSSCRGNGNCEKCQGSGICKVCEGKGVKWE